ATCSPAIADFTGWGRPAQRKPIVARPPQGNTNRCYRRSTIFSPPSATEPMSDRKFIRASIPYLLLTTLCLPLSLISSRSATSMISRDSHHFPSIFPFSSIPSFSSSSSFPSFFHLKIDIRHSTFNPLHQRPQTDTSRIDSSGTVDPLRLGIVGGLS